MTNRQFEECLVREASRMLALAKQHMGTQCKHPEHEVKCYSYVLFCENELNEITTEIMDNQKVK